MPNSGNSVPEKAQLQRSLGLFSSFALVVTSMIGSGVFKKVAAMSASLGSPLLVILAWIFAGLVSLAGALTNAEVTALLPGAGGQYAYFRQMYGKTFAFFFGWATFTVIQSSTIAAVAYVFAQTINQLYTLPRLPASVEKIGFIVFQPFENSGVKVVTIALIGTLTMINYYGVKYGNVVSKLIGSITIVSITIIVLLGFSIGSGSMQTFATHASNYVEQPVFSFAFVSLMVLAMRDAFWGYDGWNNLGYMSMEIKDPQKTIPKTLVLGVGFVMFVYCTINFVYLYILPIDQLIAVDGTENGIAAIEVVKTFLGPIGVLLVMILILITTLGSTNGTILTAARLYYSMAMDKLFFAKAAHIHPEYKTPSYSLVMQGIWSSALVLSGSFDQLTDMLIFAAFLYYGAMAFGVFVLRYRLPHVPRTVKAWGYPVVPALFIAFCVTLVVISLVKTPRECLFGLFLILTGLPFYLFWLKKHPEVHGK